MKFCIFQAFTVSQRITEPVRKDNPLEMILLNDRDFIEIINVTDSIDKDQNTGGVDCFE